MERYAKEKIELLIQDIENTDKLDAGKLKMKGIIRKVLNYDEMSTIVELHVKRFIGNSQIGVLAYQQWNSTWNV